MVWRRFDTLVEYINLRNTKSHVFRALIGYWVLALVFLAPLLFKITTHILADDAFITPGISDAYTSLWSYWWIQKALVIGHNLLFCDWVLPPTGADLFYQTTTLAPTILTLPLAKLFGVVAGYNLMVMGLIVMGAWVYYIFLRQTLPISGIVAFVTAALFGFCPYFVFKAHAHLNLIGAGFWGGTLAVLLISYYQRSFPLRRALLFAVLFWLTFWTSFVEFFMLLIALAVVVIAFEVRGLRNNVGGLWRRLLFFLPGLLGGIPAAWWLWGKDTSVLAKPLYDNFNALNLITPPKLSLLSALGSAAVPEYWGTYLSISVVVLAAVGIVAMKKTQAANRVTILVLAGVMLLFTLDPFHLVSGPLRMLPLGQGFRVFARFFPFMMFFLLIPVGYGLDFLLRKPRSPQRLVILALLLVVACVEYYPVRLSPSPVAKSCMSKLTASRIDRSKFVWLIPKRGYLNRDDTYQVVMDMRFVNLSYLARENDSLRIYRESHFPVVYMRRRADVGELEDELRRLNVGYLLFERTPKQGDIPPKGEVIVNCEGMTLVDISRQLQF